MYLNGRILPESEASISPFDHGFLYGLGVFETFRIYKGHPFLLKEHIKRMQVALSELNIQLTLSIEDLIKILNELMKMNGYENARVRLNVSAGNGTIGLQTEPYINPNIMIFVNPLPAASDHLSSKTAVLLKQRRNTPESAFRLKSHHYLNNIVAKREIGAENEVEGVFLNEKGYLAEGIVSNIFWVKKGIIFTPSIQTGILNGITRQFVIQLATTHGILVEEGEFLLDDLREADEMFMTNSIQEIVALDRLEGVKEFAGVQGDVTGLLFRKYKTLREHLFQMNE
jgi:4-amino-4-deoxychorismate lyase